MLIYPVAILSSTKLISENFKRVILYPLYFVLFGVISSIIRGGSIETLLSMASFSLPILHLIVGACFALTKKNMNFSYSYFSYIIIVLTLVLFVSDLIYGSFPRGCGYEGRWGGCIGNLEVYGFPNPPMNFLACVSVLLGIFLIRPVKKSVRMATIVSLAIIGFILLLSLSRSAVLIYVVSLGFIAFSIWGARSLFAVIIIGLIIAFNIESILDSFLVSGVLARTNTALAAGDISTGRIGIWIEALHVIAKDPIFGVGFLSFSNFSSFGTAHQQYLEVLFKVGAIGFFMYFFPLGRGYKAAINYLQKKYTEAHSPKEQTLALGFVSCVLIASVFQPAISYQTLGNFVFFSAGYFTGRVSYKRTKK